MHFSNSSGKQNITHLVLLGISLMICGLLAMYFSFFSTLITIVSLGIFLVTMGIYEIIQSYMFRTLQHFFLHLFLGVIYTIGGTLVMLHPLISELNITLLLAFYLIIAGLVNIILSATHYITHRLSHLINGSITFILGLLIWVQWPDSGLWLLGTCFGINALFSGFSLLILAYTMRHEKL